jgi:plastocyanin
MRGSRMRVYGVIVIGVMMLTTVACSSSDDNGDTGNTGDSGGGAAVPTTSKIGIADFQYEPSTLSIAAGPTDITVTNSDTTDHTFTLDDGAVDQTVAAGETVTVTVEGTSGESLGFHCEIHPQMTGTLDVA